MNRHYRIPPQLLVFHFAKNGPSFNCKPATIIEGFGQILIQYRLGSLGEERESEVGTQ